MDFISTILHLWKFPSGCNRSAVFLHHSNFGKEKELLLELRESKRFSNLLLSGYRNELDDLENPGQFSADMIQISDSLYFISYSGTDGTIIGQKKGFSIFLYIYKKNISYL